MSIPLPPIYRDCRRLLVHTEDVVRRFSRHHKYTLQADASLNVNMPARWQVLRLRAMRRFFSPKGK